MRNLSTWVIAALRNETFFSLEELNEAVQLKLKEFNEQPFTKSYKKGSRKEAFLAEEQSMLHSLPPDPYKMVNWKTATVQPDYHINVDNRFYSVPHQYISTTVQVKLTTNLIEVFVHDNRIAAHKRLYGKFGQVSTNRNHMPTNHQLYVDHTPKSAMKWAQGIGVNTLKVMRYFLKDNSSDRRGLKTAFSFKSLTHKYAAVEIEAACETVTKIATAPTLTIIKQILKNQQQPKTKSKNEEDHGFSRGAGYYGGNK
ncbi:Mu transposase domain-containing protein [Xylocopilactobacillus apicola]|uniref:Transposase n=1 Tax=Xylocopilactobacillus apicola TaxID=2932184 RepID=A0AAU9D0C3_9LACO|nr:transposase [Xylocopilactobacillus apicola]BDR59714.1 transposase [Xylocopilactobacillus apicola]